jgi:hypothetical protein
MATFPKMRVARHVGERLLRLLERKRLVDDGLHVRGVTPHVPGGTPRTVVAWLRFPSRWSGPSRKAARLDPAEALIQS